MNEYRERKVNEHQCRICSAIFEATRFDARYCSPACRQRASRIKRMVDQLQAKKQPATAVDKKASKSR